MIIVSWDVGIIHLAYCVLECDKNGENPQILDWDVINLIKDERAELSCCGKNKNKSVCGKKATYCLQTANETVGFCKTHLTQHEQYWSDNDTLDLFCVLNNKKVNIKNNKKKECTFVKKDGKCCGKTAKSVYKNGDVKEYYCTTHHRSELKKKLKEFKPQLIKKTAIKKYSTAKLQLALVNKLDELLPRFKELGVQEVVIENQPAKKNPKMKSIANTLFDYFLIRGQVDGNIDLDDIRLMCPSNKLRVNEHNTLEVLKSNKESKKYKLTKQLSIQYTRQLINKSQNRYLDRYKKKDDICDAYLQGRYYLQFIRHKPTCKISKKSSSKTNSKSSSKTNRKSSHKSGSK